MLCSICHNDLCNWTTKCNHKFHKLCLNQWRVINPTCPMCRESLNCQTDSAKLIVRNYINPNHPQDNMLMFAIAVNFLANKNENKNLPAMQTPS